MLRSSVILFAFLLCSCCDCDHSGFDTILSPEIAEASAEPDTVAVDLVQVLIDYRQWYADTLKTYLGRREVGTSNKGRDIDQFFNGCSVGPGHAWCACFANYGLISIGGQGPEGSAWSPSWFPDSKVVYRRGQSDARDRLETGWVFGIYFSNLKRVAHVGVIVEDLRDGYVVTVEGNTNGMGSREGHGVFLKIRHKDEIFVCSDWIN